MKNRKRITSIILVLSLFLSLIVVPSYKVKAEDSSGVEIYTSTAMPEYVDMYYVVTVDNNCKKVTITYHIKDENCVQMQYNFHGHVITTTVVGNHTTTSDEGVVISFGNISVNNSVATIEFDFSEKAIEGYEEKAGKSFDNYSFYFIANNETDATNSALGTIGKITIQDGRISFSYDHEHEQKTIDYFNEYCNPEIYDGYSMMDYSLYYKNGFLKEIKEKSESITGGCTTNEEKVYAIYRWIAENISYDYLARDIIEGKVTVSNAEELSSIATNPDKVYRYKRAVCDGYTQLARLMLVSVGIPCINLSGDCYSHGDSSLGMFKRITHAWNAVYINHTWAFFDFTWGSGGKYYGENSEKNVSPYLAGTKWFANTATFGKDHVSYLIFWDHINYEVPLGDSKEYKYLDYRKELMGIRPVSPKKIYTVGSTFEPCKYTYLVSDGTEIRPFEECAKKNAGYDLKKTGTYTVTFSDEYGVFQSSYDIKVVSALDKPVVKKATVKGKKLSLSWGKISTAGGYEVQYSLYKGFQKSRNTKHVFTSKTALNLNKLKTNKTYYVKVRAYKAVDGCRVYSKWSNVKKFRT